MAFVLKLEPSLQKKLEKEADKNDRSMHAEVKQMIKECLEKREAVNA